MFKMKLKAKMKMKAKRLKRKSKKTAIFGNIGLLMRVKKNLKYSLAQVKELKAIEESKYIRIKMELEKYTVLIKTDKVCKILEKPMLKRSRKEKVVLYGFSLRYPILRKISEILLVDNYIKFINTF